jgi:hypothetical protein
MASNQKIEVLQKQNGDAQFYFQRSTVIFRFMGPQSNNEPYLSSSVFSVSLTVTTTSTAHHIILSVHTDHMCTCSVYVLITYVCVSNLVLSSTLIYSYVSTLLRIS